MDVVVTKNLDAALAKAMQIMKNPIKDCTNPHFRAGYASLESVLSEIKGPCLANGLVVTQAAFPLGEVWVLETELRHAPSGEGRKALFPLTPGAKLDAQAYGSAMSYARRYSLLALFGLAAEDDDGNVATASAKSAPSKPAARPAAPAQRPTPPLGNTGPFPESEVPFSAGPTAPAAAKPAQGGLSQPQVRLLWATANKAGWTESDVMDLLGSMGLTSTSEIRWQQFDGVLKTLTAGPKTFFAGNPQ